MRLASTYRHLNRRELTLDSLVTVLTVVTVIPL